MGFWSKLLGVEKRVNLSNPQVPLSGGNLGLALGGGYSSPTPFGTVNSDIALQFSAYYAGVRVIAETIASLPWILYQSTPQGKDRAINHPLYRIVHDRPNEYMTSYTFRELMAVSIINRGNFFAYIERDAAGRVVNLMPLDGNSIEVGVIDGKKVYKYQWWTQASNAQPSVQRITYIQDEDMFHVMGLSTDGVVGKSVVNYARNSIGLGLAAEHHSMQFFAQGMNPSGVLSYPGKLSNDAKLMLKQSWESAYAGIKGAHRVPLLEEGLTFSPFNMNKEDTSWVLSRKFQIEEVARWLRIPPHKIGSLEKATFSNIEQQALEFTSDTLRPFCEKIEQEAERKLLNDAEKDTYFTELLLDGLLRGDMKTRYESYAIGRQWGWLSPDDVREIENMNKLPDNQGSVYLYPTNMGNALALLAVPEPPEDPTEALEDDTTDDSDTADENPDDISGRSLIDATAITLTDALARMFRKESEAVKRAANKQDTTQATDDFYAKHQQTLTDALTPALTSLALLIADKRKAPADKAIETARAFAELAAKQWCDERKDAPDIETTAKEWGRKLVNLMMGVSHGL